MPSAPLHTVHVPLEGRAYDILIGKGLLESAGERLKAQFPGRRFGIVTDTAVARSQLPRLAASLDAAALAHATITVPNGAFSTSRPSSGGLDHSFGSNCLTSYMK